MMPALDDDLCVICDTMVPRDDLAYQDRVKRCRSCRGLPPRQVEDIQRKGFLETEEKAKQIDRAQAGANLGAVFGPLMTEEE